MKHSKKIQSTESLDEFIKRGGTITKVDSPKYQDAFKNKLESGYQKLQRTRIKPRLKP